MSDAISADIMQAASEAHADFARSSVSDNLTLIIAKAILAERQRCIAECDYVTENIRVKPSERKRFDLWDMNQTFKGAVKCVRERIEGDWEKNWKPDPDVIATTGTVGGIKLGSNCDANRTTKDRADG